jgi:excisionase family DNA binding protein
MKPGNAQFGMRENPASLGQHDSHLAVQSAPAPSPRSVAATYEESRARSSFALQEPPVQPANNAAHTAATSGKERSGVADELHFKPRTSSPEGTTTFNSHARHGDEFPLTVREAAKFLGVSPQTVYLWVERKQIPHLRVMGRNIRFLKSDLEPFRASFKQEMENE